MIRPIWICAKIGEPAEAEADAREALGTDAFAALLARVKSILGERVSDVRESKTLVASPARLVSQDDSANRYMFRINRILDQDYELPVRALELNPRHALMHNLGRMVESDGQSDLVETVVEQVFETALLQDGLHPDPSEHGGASDAADAGGDGIGQRGFALRRGQVGDRGTGAGRSRGTSRASRSIRSKKMVTATRHDQLLNR